MEIVAFSNTRHAYPVNSYVYARDSWPSKEERYIMGWSMVLTWPGEGSSNNYAYLVVDDKSKDAVIIDPANPPEYGRICREAYWNMLINAS